MSGLSRKVTIIGAGSVGSTIAYTLSRETIASEIVLIDVNKEKAHGEVMDIEQGTAFRDPITIKSGDYADAAGSSIVIITSGIARKPGQTRLELAQTNVNIIKSIAPEITAVAPDALYIIVSNPVDVLTYVFMKVSGIPENHIIGSGTLLDTARLRYKLSEHFGVAQSNVHTYVLGEHGDTSLVPWSVSSIAGVSVDEYADLLNIDPVDKDEVLHYVRKSGGEIIANKGATYYAVSASVVKICSILMSATDTITSVSCMMHGEYGIEDVCLSTSVLIGPNGFKGRVPLRISYSEEKKLRQSADALKEIISQLEI